MFIALLGVLSLSISAWAQVSPQTKGNQTSAISLEALQAEVLEVHPEIQAARLKMESAKEEIPQADSLEDPTFAVTQWAIPSLSQPGNAEETWYGVSQSLPFPGKRALQRDVATSDAFAAEQAFHGKIRELMARVKVAFYQLFLADKSVLLYLEHQTLLEEFIKIATKKYAMGQVSQQEILMARLELTKLHTSLLVLEQERLGVRAQINTLRNRTPDNPIVQTENLAYRPFPLSINDLTQRAMARQPELSAARFMIEKSQHTRALANKNRLPDFMVETAYMDFHTDSNAWMLSVKINLPWLFTAKYDAQTRQAALREAEARADYATLQNQTLFEVQNLFTKVKTSETRIEAYQKGLLPQAEQMLAAAQIGYQSGKVSFLDLIESERARLDFQMEYFGVLVQFFDAVAQLEHAVGEEIKF